MDPYSLKDQIKIHSAMGNPPVHSSSQRKPDGEMVLYL